GNQAESQAEFGDILFSIVNIARKLDIDPESALAETNQRFRERFSAMETEAKKQGKLLNEQSLEALETMWQTAKGKST
ncbi:hypothetical protein EBR96_07320, partial [bacterium]|nr:hypothetical protein [bacterium]